MCDCINCSAKINLLLTSSVLFYPMNFISLLLVKIVVSLNIRYNRFVTTTKKIVTTNYRKRNSYSK